MKKLCALIFIVGLFAALITNDYWLSLFSKMNRTRTTGGDFFRDLSLGYYGTPEYSDELALVNQAVIRNSYLDDHGLIIPSLDAIRRLYETYDFSLAQQIIPQIMGQETNSIFKRYHPIKVFQSSISLPLIGIGFIVAIIIGYLLGKRQNKRELRIAQLNLLPKPDKKRNRGNRLDSIRNNDELLVHFEKP